MKWTQENTYAYMCFRNAITHQNMCLLEFISWHLGNIRNNSAWVDCPFLVLMYVLLWENLENSMIFLLARTVSVQTKNDGDGFHLARENAWQSQLSCPLGIFLSKIQAWERNPVWTFFKTHFDENILFVSKLEDHWIHHTQNYFIFGGIFLLSFCSHFELTKWNRVPILQ